MQKGLHMKKIISHDSNKVLCVKTGVLAYMIVSLCFQKKTRLMENWLLHYEDYERDQEIITKLHCKHIFKINVLNMLEYSKL